jgi:hypothetical protein
MVSAQAGQFRNHWAVNLAIAGDSSWQARPKLAAMAHAGQFRSHRRESDL